MSVSARPATIEVDNPYFGPAAPEEHRRITAIRSLQDPLSKLHHTRRIDDTELRAGRHMQALLETAEVGKIGSIDPSREGVDGGNHMPDVLTDRQRDALKALVSLWPKLGLDGAALVRAVLAEGVMPEDYARRLFTSARDINAMGRLFKWKLGLLATEFGYAS